jgi:hypothetical protein
MDQLPFRLFLSRRLELEAIQFIHLLRNAHCGLSNFRRTAPHDERHTTKEKNQQECFNFGDTANPHFYFLN